MNTIRLYLQGFSYQVIADRVGFAKGSTVTILSDLRNGKFPGLENISDEVDALREIGMELRRRDLSISQATVGIAAFQGIDSLGVQPSEVKNVIEQVRRLTPGGVETREFLSAVSAVTELEQRTGMAPKELEERVGELENKYHTLEQRCKEFEPMSKEAVALTKRRDSLITQLAALEAEAEKQKESLDAEIAERTERVKKLQSQIADTEQLVGQLGRRVFDQEESLQQISCRSDRASNDLKRILSLGFSENELAELATRLASAAHHHNIEPNQFQEWLFTCLDQAGSLLGLDTIIKSRRNELIKEEKKLATARKSKETLAAKLKALKKNGADERAAQMSLRKAWEQEIEAVGSTFTQAATAAAEDNEARRQSLGESLLIQRQELQKAAQALGSLEGKIDSYAWVGPLVNLIQGKEGVTTKELRIAATFLCLVLRRYLNLHVENRDKPARIESLLGQLLEVLEAWTTYQGAIGRWTRYPWLFPCWLML